MTSGSWIKLAAVLTLLLGAPAFAAQNPAFHALMDALAARRSSTVRFHETKSLHILNSTIEQSGTLSYVAPDTVIRDVRTPKPERFIIRGNSFTMEKDGQRKTMRVDQLPVAHAFVEAFRATLSGNEVVLKRYYKVTFSGSLARWELRLVPRDKRLSHEVRAFVWKGRRTRVTRIDIFARNGDSTRIDLTPVTAPAHAVPK